MKKKYLLFNALLLIGQALSAQVAYTLRIDPENAHGGTSNQLFDSIRFVPLETTTESLFGSIDQLEVTDSFYVILDIRSRSILIFTREGKMHARIRSGGLDKFFGYFAIDNKNHHILVINNFAKGLLFYDFSGNLLDKQKCPERLQSLYFFNNRDILYNIKRPLDPSSAPLHTSDLAYSHNYSETYKYLNYYNPKFETGEYNMPLNPINFSGQFGSCMFSLPFDYKVYQINDTGIIAKYNFLFPQEYSLPQNFTTDSIYVDHRAEYIYSNHENYKKISAVSSVYRLGEHLLFTAQSGQMSQGADWNYLYNLKTNSLISFAKVTGDSTSYYFPLLSGILEKVNSVHEGKIYSSFPAFRIFAIKNNLDKQVTYPASLRDFLSTGTKNNNPVIVEFKLRANL